MMMGELCMTKDIDREGKWGELRRCMYEYKSH